MNAFTVILALLCAASNAASTVFQRRAHVEESDDSNGDGGDGDTDGDDGESFVTGLLRSLKLPFWWAGAAAIVSGAVFQVLALDSGSLTVVQPLLASELLFTLLLGAVVFRERPRWATWRAFVMLAVGLAAFLIAAAPKEGSAEPSGWRWFVVGGGVALCIAGSILVARRLAGALRSATLGIATAMGFATTAAFIKEMTREFSNGAAAVLTSWPIYAAAAAGLASMLLLQWTLRAGTLTASQPALTLGDALISVALGGLLFEEQVALGWRLLPQALAVALIAAGVIGLSRTSATDAGQSWDETAPE